LHFQEPSVSSPLLLLLLLFLPPVIVRCRPWFVKGGKGGKEGEREGGREGGRGNCQSLRGQTKKKGGKECVRLVVVVRMDGGMEGGREGRSMWNCHFLLFEWREEGGIEGGREGKKGEKE